MRSGFPREVPTLPLTSGSRFDSRSHREQILLDFGCSDREEDGYVSAYVSAFWVQASSRITCSPAPEGTADHEPTDVAVEGVVFRAVGIMPGAGFTLTGFAPNGTWGHYLVNITGS